MSPAVVQLHPGLLGDSTMQQTRPLKRIRPLDIRGRGVTAALPPFKRNGKGSIPFGPTELALATYRGGA